MSPEPGAPVRCAARRRSHTAAIDRIEAMAAVEGIDCGFERLDGYRERFRETLWRDSAGWLAAQIASLKTAA
ncbi:MAG TPA: hypothetical protein VGG03_07760 [Thermoanaerobaculia bacterium]